MLGRSPPFSRLLQHCGPTPWNAANAHDELGDSLGGFLELSKDLQPEQVNCADSHPKLHRRAEALGWIKHSWATAPNGGRRQWCGWLTRMAYGAGLRFPGCRSRASVSKGTEGSALSRWGQSCSAHGGLAPRLRSRTLAVRKKPGRYVPGEVRCADELALGLH